VVDLLKADLMGFSSNLLYMLLQAAAGTVIHAVAVR
jgi:hypothetical protein